MTLQRFEEKNRVIREKFMEFKKQNPDRLKQKLNFSWSNWGFGIEPLTDTVKRLKKNKIEFIELHGNRYSSDLGYNPKEVKKILDDNGIKVAGICGMFSLQNDLSSNIPLYRQNAIDYIRRNVDLGVQLGAGYILLCPGAVGRPAKYDDMEFERSVETLQLVTDCFTEIRGAIEPIRAAETSLVHTFAEAERYIESVNNPGIAHINGDVYHMLAEENHIAQTIIDYGSRLINLHLADSNRRALGDGLLDLDIIIMALYLIGFNNNHSFCTAEPLGPGGDPYPAMYGKPEPEVLDTLVAKTVEYWREREEVVRNL